MRITTAAIVILGFCLMFTAGCRRKAPAETEEIVRTNSGLPTQQEQLEELEEDVKTAANAVEDEKLQIPQSTEKGWNTASTQPTDLADETDARFNEEKTLRCEANTIMKWYYPDGGEDTLSGLSLILVEDSDTYRLEYYMKESGAILNRIYADDGEYAIMDHKGVRHQKPRTISGNVTAGDLDRLADTMARDLVSVWLDDGPGIDPIIEAYRNGVGGYELSTETRTVMFEGEPRKQHRYFARTEQGTPTEVEIVLDGEFYRPVTMRVTRELEGGVTLRKIWTGKWYSGGTHESSMFAIPPESTN